MGHVGAEAFYAAGWSGGISCGTLGRGHSMRHVGAEAFLESRRGGGVLSLGAEASVASRRRFMHTLERWCFMHLAGEEAFYAACWGGVILCITLERRRFMRLFRMELSFMSGRSGGVLYNMPEP